MDYEKAYKEALERAIKIHSKERITGIELVTCEEIFPELRESEDKRIREEIVDYLKKFIPHRDDDLVAKSKLWIAWLEKQGEQKSIEWSEEDREMLDNCLGLIQEIDSTQEEQNWLKSLKPNHWKPSEEQMNALNWVAYNYALMDKGTEEKLQSLHNDLLKL